MWTNHRRPQFEPQRGAANGLLLAVVVVILGGLAIFFYPRDPDGPVNPEEGVQGNQGTPEAPSGKIVPKVGGADGEGVGENESGSGNGESARTTGQNGNKKVVLTPLQKQIMEWEGLCHDPAASAKDQLAAIAALRKTDKDGEQYVPLMTQMLEEAKTDELAIGMILEMRKRKHLEFGMHLMDAAMKRRSEEVKIAAIRTLGAYMEEPALKSLLSQMEEGGSPEITEEVRAAIEGRKDHWDQGPGR